MWLVAMEEAASTRLAFKSCRFLQPLKALRVLPIAMLGTLRVVHFVRAAVAVGAAKERAVRQVQADWVGQVADLLGHPSEILLSLPRTRTGLLESTSWAAAVVVAVQAPLSMEFQEAMVA